MTSFGKFQKKDRKMMKNIKSQLLFIGMKLVLTMRKFLIQKPRKKLLKMKNGMAQLILLVLNLLDGVVINILHTMVLSN
jgi:hypothetical protein